MHVTSPHHEVTDVAVPVRAPELHVLSDTDPRAPLRPSRRVALVPDPEDMHPTSSQGAEHTFSMHQGKNLEGRDVAARVSP